MKITRISVYKTHLPYVGGEFAPCGENYMIAHSEGVEAVTKLLAPHLIGQDPRQVAKIERLMDHAVQGHGYAKAPIDAACWDILGKATDQPVWMLMGGKLCDGAPMYRVIPQKSNLGGLSKARRVRDYFVENHIPVVSEDTWGGQITTAAVAHFAASTPEEFLINSTDLQNYNTRNTGIGGPTTKDGRLYATDTPGLGVAPDYDSLGAPVAIYGE